MISFLEGNIDTILDNGLVLDTGGVGYYVSVAKTTLNNVSVGSPAKLYTYMHVSENKIALYGFNTYQEVGFFELLTSVSGIGPKVALGLLNSDTPDGLVTSIIAEDIQKIQKAPGVGSKTARRIVLELKDKIAKIEGIKILPPVQGTNDAAEALLALGYNQKDVYQVVAQISKSTNNTEEIIKMSLRELS